MAHCASGRLCLWWVERYLKECVCGMRDYISVAFGLLSVFIWVVAEIPQIVTNFKSGSTEGLSLTFLIAWLAGDLLNLIGCFLDRATLPSQLYIALFYTIATAILVGQNLYYDKWLKEKKQRQNHTSTTDARSEQEHENITGQPMIADSEISTNVISPRSIGSNDKPTPRSYPPASSREDSASRPRYKLKPSSVSDEGIPANLVSSCPVNSNTRLRCVAGTLFFVGGLNCLHIQSFDSAELQRPSVVLRARKILELPSQLYIALFYTIATAILVGQNLYYDKWLKEKKQHQNHTSTTDAGSEQEHENIREQPMIFYSEISTNVISPRSIGSTGNPTPCSYPPASSREDSASRPRYKLKPSSVSVEGIPDNLVSSCPVNSNTRLRCIAGTLFFVGGLNCVHVQSFDSAEVQRSSVVLRERKILEDVRRTTRKQSTSAIGTCLGWLMTAVDVGGQLSQICLNVKRGAVEGLSPLMLSLG